MPLLIAGVAALGWRIRGVACFTVLWVPGLERALDGVAGSDAKLFGEAPYARKPIQEDGRGLRLLPAVRIKGEENLTGGENEPDPYVVPVVMLGRERPSDGRSAIVAASWVDGSAACSLQLGQDCGPVMKRTQLALWGNDQRRARRSGLLQDTSHHLVLIVEQGGIDVIRAHGRVKTACPCTRFGFTASPFCGEHRLLIQDARD